MRYKDIKEFSQRCEEHPDHQNGMISHQMLLDRAHEEIDELRKYIEQRTWVALTDDDELDWEEGSSLKDLVKAIESKLREKNESREWQDLTDDEMLMIYGQKHEGKKYNLGRMVQQALKEKNNV